MTMDSSLGFAPCLYSEYSGYTESEPKTSFRHAFIAFYSKECLVYPQPLIAIHLLIT